MRRVVEASHKAIRMVWVAMALAPMPHQSLAALTTAAVTLAAVTTVAVVTAAVTTAVATAAAVEVDGLEPVA
jgi:hypothetical protein